MKSPTRIRASLAALAALCLLSTALGSCDNEFGIISSIQTEKPQVGTKLFLNTTVSGIVSFGTSVYASSARVYSRLASGGDWSQVTVGPSSSYTALSMAATSAALYIAILDTAGESKVYSYDGSSWTELGKPADIVSPDSFIVDALFAAGTEVYAQAHITASDGSAVYSLYRLASGSFSTAVAGLVRFDSPLVGVAERGSGSGEFWYVTRGTSSSSALTAKVIKGTSTSADTTATATDAASAAGLLAGDNVNSIAVAGNLLFLGATDGVLHATSDGSTWSTGSPGGSDGIALGAIALVNDGSNDRLLVGTDAISYSKSAVGYYEGIWAGSIAGTTFASGSDGAFTLNSSVYSTTISGKPVLRFLYDGTNKALYACLAPGASNGLYGLYSTKLVSGAWTGWAAE